MHHGIVNIYNTLYDGEQSVNLVVGEPISKTSSINESTITQGFFQPEYFVVNNIEKHNSDVFFTAFPNPSPSIINLIFDNDCSSNLSLEIYDFLGKEVYEKNIILDFQRREFVDVEGFPGGMYIFVISDHIKNRKNSIKIIVQ